MYMKPIKAFLIPTLFLLAACQADEEPGTSSVPATIAQVTIQQPKAATRVLPIDEYGYIGVQKMQFVPGDVIDIAYYHGEKPQTAIAVGEPGTGALPTWTTDPNPLYINPGDEARITATHLSPADDKPGTSGTTNYADILEGTATVDYTASPARISFSFAHARSLLRLGTVTEITGGNTLTVDRSQPIIVGIDDATVALTPEGICPAEARLATIAFTLENGKAYTAVPLIGEAIITQPGKRHTLNIALNDDQATITSAEISPWGEEKIPEIIPVTEYRLIYDEKDLMHLRDDCNGINGPEMQAEALAANVLQMDNVVLAQIWDKPIAETTFFTGQYNGNNYTITGLTVNNTTGNAALFGVTNGATLTNIHLCQIKITGNYTGALVGYDGGNTTISLCSANGSVTGNDHTGGLVAVLGNGSTLLRSRATCTLTGNGNSAGGLVGYNHGTILGCMTDGSITGNATNKGGLVGVNDTDGTIYHSYSTINTGNDNTCVAGQNTGAIRSSYGVGGRYDSSTDTPITDGTVPGDLVRQGSHTVNNVEYLGTKIWTEGDYPTLRYTYEGE